MATAKQIPSLLDAERAAVSSWEEMAEAVLVFFRKNFGDNREELPPETNAANQERILALLSDKLTEEEKFRLNEPLSLLELELAMRDMKGLKCPGPDGAPVEFYKALWPTVGPLLLQALTTGICRREFGEDLSLGMIVLLPKKNDQRILNNTPIVKANYTPQCGI